MEHGPPSAGFSLPKINLALGVYPCTMNDMKGNKPDHKRVTIMSYKDLEAEIRAWANLEQHAKQQKELAQESKREQKRQKREAKQRAPLTPKPVVNVEKPVTYHKYVLLEVRDQTDRVWGELKRTGYAVDAMSDTDAELQAIKLAKSEGFVWDSTVSIKLV